MSGLKINSNVTSASDLKLPVVSGVGSGTPDVLNRIHQMARASHTSNLWSIPTDCKRAIWILESFVASLSTTASVAGPQRERRGWTGDAQASSDEANMNYDMQERL